MLAEWETKCGMGDMEACTQLAYARDGGWYGIPRDRRSALDLFRRACDGNVARACINVAVAYDRGNGLPQNRPIAVSFFRKSCDLGDANGCENLAMHLAGGEGIARDPAVAVATWQKGCDLGSANVCRNLASELENGDRVPRDAARGLALHIRACDLGQTSDCLTAARTLRATPTTDAKTFVRLYDKACEDAIDTAGACVELGDMYRDGDRVAKDIERALALYRRGCQGGFVRACRAARALAGEPEPGLDEKLAATDYLVSIPGSIHPTLGPVRFRFFADEYGRFSRIDVFDERANRVVQQITRPASPDGQGDAQTFPGGIPRVDFPDLNFDGYKDLTVLEWAGATGNSGGVVWIFNPARRQFVYNRALSDEPNVEPDAERKVLTTFWTGGHSGMICGGTAIKWINGRPVTIESVDQDYDRARNAYVKNVHERRGGRLVLTTRETLFAESGNDEVLIEHFEGGRVRSAERKPADPQPSGCIPPATRR